MASMQYDAARDEYVGEADGQVVRVDGSEVAEVLATTGDDPVEMARALDPLAWLAVAGFNEHVHVEPAE